MNESKINVLLIGGGGREHALADAIARAPSLGTLFATHTSNPGIGALAEPVDVPVSIKEIYRLRQVCDKRNIGLVVIGPEDPLADGFTDALTTPSRAVFGPIKAAARLEADKAWAKQLMRSASVPTAESRAFTNAEVARAYIESREDPLVVKAAGLAKGKGVIVCDTPDEALDAVRRVMIAREFGDAGATCIVEERMTGPEVSVFALVDGNSIFILESCQDYKRLLDEGKGPNTGGMGAYCPSTLLDDTLIGRIQHEILIPTIDALKRDEITYRGVLYAGLMLTHAGPKVLEFNVRFGDPECQVLMPRLESDAVQLLLATATGHLDEVDVAWRPGAACCIVLASAGYPESPRTGVTIEGLDDVVGLPEVHLYHAGTKRATDGRIVTDGGRALDVVATGRSLADARDRAYAAAELVTFPGMQMRRDIASMEAAPQA